jgi:hypothetical protein
MSLAQLAHRLLLMPDSPIACTSYHPPGGHAADQSSWISAFNAYSDVLRASRNGGK